MDSPKVCRHDSVMSRLSIFEKTTIFFFLCVMMTNMHSTHVATEHGGYRGLNPSFEAIKASLGLNAEWSMFATQQIHKANFLFVSVTKKNGERQYIRGPLFRDWNLKIEPSDPKLIFEDHLSPVSSSLSPTLRVEFERWMRSALRYPSPEVFKRAALFFSIKAIDRSILTDNPITAVELLNESCLTPDWNEKWIEPGQLGNCSTHVLAKYSVQHRDLVDASY